MSEQQPEVRWAPLPPAPKRTGRTWLIVGLIVAAVVIAGIVLALLLPRGGDPTTAPTPSGTPSPSASATATVAPSPSATVEPTEQPEEPPTTAPPATDNTIEVFRGQVSGWLNDAPRGLDIVAGASGQDALPVVDTLQQDAQRLSDAQPPSSISQAWRDGVAAYAERLVALRSAITGSGDVDAAVSAARTAAQDLRTLVGL